MPIPMLIAYAYASTNPVHRIFVPSPVAAYAYAYADASAYAYLHAYAHA